MQKTAIIVITHKRPIRILERCLLSIVRQQYKNFDCFVIDDCKSKEVKELTDNYGFIYKGVSKCSQAAAWAYGLSLARHYEYIKFVHDDDWISEWNIKDSVEVLDRFKDCNLVINAASARLPGSDTVFYMKGNIQIPKKDFIKTCLTVGNGGLPESPSTIMVRNYTDIRMLRGHDVKHFGNTVESWAEKVYFNDLLFIIEAAKSNKSVVMIDRINTFFGTDADSITLTAGDKVSQARAWFRVNYKKIK